MGPDTTDAHKIAPLNDDNFFNWKFKMQMLLIDEGLWEISTGEETIADLGNRPSDKQVGDFNARCKKALATICLGMDDNQIMHVRSCVTAKEAWENLCKVCEKGTLSNKLYLRRKLMTTKMQPTGKIQAHINGLKQLACQLDGLGSTVSEDELITILLCSLPVDYQNLVTALE